MPASRDEPEQRPEQASQPAALLQQFVDVVFVKRCTATDALEGTIESEQNDQVRYRDNEQEQCRGRGADHAADLATGGEAVGQRCRRQCDRDRSDQHHRRMAEREEQADCHRSLSLLHQLACDVVDGGDVIGIERVPQPERIGEHGCSDQHRLPRECGERPHPCENIGDDQRGQYGDQPGAKAVAGSIGQYV